MKRILLFALMGFAASCPNLQAENQTVVEGRSWNYLISLYNGADPSNNRRYLAKGYHFQGTTTLDGKEYNIFRDEKGKEIAYMREEDRRVYLYTHTGDDTFQLGYSVDTDMPEVMIYDFNCKEGESFQSVGFDDMAFHDGIPFEGMVESTGEISYDGKNFFYQDINFSGNEGDSRDNVCFIESLGAQHGLLPFPQFGNLTSGMRKGDETLFSVTDADGTVIYKNTALAESLNGNIRTDLDWQYFEAYGYLQYNADLGYLERIMDGRVVNYSFVKTDGERYPYAWTCNDYTKWKTHDFRDPDSQWEYEGESQVNEAQAYLREEDGKVYISLESLNIPKEEPYYWFEGQNELSIWNPETNWFSPYTPSEGEEVILYNYTANVGDRYRTLILGSVICDVTVVSVTDTSRLPEAERIPGGGKVIEVMSDYAKATSFNQSSNVIKYAEGIGNISLGNYIFLVSELSPVFPPEDGSYGRWLINNVYDKDGSIFFKGYDFQGLSGVKDIQANNLSNGKIYDLFGREVSSPVSGSIYIRDGKKFVAE